jgi:hypothetical protein
VLRLLLVLGSALGEFGPLQGHFMPLLAAGSTPCFPPCAEQRTPAEPDELLTKLPLGRHPVKNVELQCCRLNYNAVAQQSKHAQ